MGIEIQLAGGLATLEIGLGEFAAVIKTLSGAVKQEAARTTLKEMIEEVRRSYDAAVDVLAPLYKIDSPKKYSDQFSGVRSNYKSTYLKNRGNIRTHCTLVKEKLEELKKKKGWMKRIPFAQNAYTRLKQFIDDWVSSDERLIWEMESFLTNVNRFLDRVYRMGRRNPKKAFTYLEATLLQWEDKFLALKKQLDSLKIVSNGL